MGTPPHTHVTQYFAQLLRWRYSVLSVGFSPLETCRGLFQKNIWEDMWGLKKPRGAAVMGGHTN